MAEKRIHRDDVDMDVMSEIESLFAEALPGFKVVCAGDLPDGHPMQENSDLLMAAMAKRFVEGRCLDCDAVIEDFPKSEENWESWEKPKDWACLYDTSDEPMGWLCPTCDAENGE